MNRLYVRRNAKGRGVYATFGLRKATASPFLVDHVLLFDADEATDDSVIHRYTFQWSKNTCALALGLGSLINHSFKPNVFCYMNMKAMTIEFFAYKDIGAGGELLLNYNGEPTSKRKVLFEVKK